MEIVVAFVVGGLYASGLYLMMRRRLAQLIMGLVLLSNGANLMVFAAGGLVRARPPILPSDADRLARAVADPLPQALVLTAIVIGFGLLSFMLALARRGYQTTGTDDVDSMRSTEGP